MNKFVVKPTIFPDGTSQVWKLPEEVMDSYECWVEWYFEAERELMDLLSLRRLLYSHPMSLFVPYLPYARQDKEVSNEKTFNLEVFADAINALRFSNVRAFDVHNEAITSRLIKNFENQQAHEFHYETLRSIKPDLIVYPDSSAATRYPWLDTRQFVWMRKHRDALTGEIETSLWPDSGLYIRRSKRIAVIDDICDGGASFIKTAERILSVNQSADLHLVVSHGLFTKGKDLLQNAGYHLHARYDWHVNWK